MSLAMRQEFGGRVSSTEWRHCAKCVAPADKAQCRAWDDCVEQRAAAAVERCPAPGGCPHPEPCLRDGCAATRARLRGPR